MLGRLPQPKSLPRKNLFSQNNTNRSSLPNCTALQLHLVGPHDSIGDVTELLPQHPSWWYLTGFLVPFEAGESQANDADAGDDIDGAGERGSTDDDQTPEQVAATNTRFTSSMGLSAK